jgi:hypothetical protein
MPSRSKLRGAESWVVICQIIIAVVVLASFAATSASIGQAASSGRVDPFCARPTIVDYERPLKALPPVQELPQSGEVPFAPASVRVSALRAQVGRLIYPEYQIRYQIRNYGQTNSHLGWTVKSRLYAIAPNGSVQSTVGESTTAVAESGPHKSTQFIEGTQIPSLGLFRADIEFFDEAGQLLGSYSEYVRSVKTTLKVKLEISDEVVRPGGKVKIRLENRGTKWLIYTTYFVVGRWEAGHWIRLPKKVLGALRDFPLNSGEAARCQKVVIPQQAPPGTYRVWKTVEDGRQELFRTATFRVIR